MPRVMGLLDNIWAGIIALIGCFGQAEEPLPRGLLATLLCRRQYTHHSPGQTTSQSESPTRRISNAELDQLPRAPTSIKTVRIIDGQLPLDIRSDPEAYYLIQHQIRTTEHDSDGNDAVSSSFEFYWISRTEIIKSSFGLGLLEKWLALDQDAPPDRRRSSLVNRLRDCYDCEYTALSQSAPQGMDELTHSWYMKKIREMDTISFEFDVGVYQNLRVSRS